MRIHSRALAGLFGVLLIGACDPAGRQVRQPVTANPASNRSAIVTAIIDGDTFEAREAGAETVRVRLAQIDAPEGDQPYGERAKENLRRLIGGRTVVITQTATDRYGRVVAEVWVGDRNVNRQMIVEGAAWAYGRYLTDNSLLAAEERARSEARGLWAQSDAVSPQEWRRGARPSRPLVASLAASASPGGMTCGTKRYCKQMTSCAEARFHLKVCGVTNLDRDADGEPCEQLCAP